MRPLLYDSESGSERFYSRVLMLKDTPLLDFRYDVGCGVTSLRVLADESLLPLGCLDRTGRVTRPSLGRWLTGRGVPRTREHLRDALDRLGLDTPEQLMLAGLALSLSDQFWIKSPDLDVSWHDINFFENPFDDRLGLALAPHSAESLDEALERLESMSPQEVSSSSPDAALGGELTKRWTIDPDGTRTLLKAGNVGHLLQEPYNEAVCSMLCERILMPGDWVPYELRPGDGSAMSACPTMVDTSCELASAIDVERSSPKRGDTSLFERYVQTCEAHGIVDARSQVEKMIVIDYLMANADRHWGNFGVIIDADSREWVRTAPIFDTGTSLWCKTPLSGELPPVHDRRHPLPFLNRPDEQLRYVRGLSWLDAGRLEGFADEAASILESDELLMRAVPQRISAVRNELARRSSKIEALSSELRGPQVPGTELSGKGLTPSEPQPLAERAVETVAAFEVTTRDSHAMSRKGDDTSTRV